MFGIKVLKKSYCMRSGNRFKIVTLKSEYQKNTIYLDCPTHTFKKVIIVILRPKIAKSKFNLIFILLISLITQVIELIFSANCEKPRNNIFQVK